MNEDTKFLICPIHGKVEGVQVQMEEIVFITDEKTKLKTENKKISKGFKCPSEYCEVQRLERDLD